MFPYKWEKGSEESCWMAGMQRSDAGSLEDRGRPPNPRKEGKAKDRQYSKASQKSPVLPTHLDFNPSDTRSKSFELWSNKCVHHTGGDLLKRQLKTKVTDKASTLWHE